MANFFRGNFLLKNNEFVDLSLLPEDQDKALYEILRVIDRVPVFWKEHFYRLTYSAKLAGVPFVMDEDQFSSSLKKLVQKCDFEFGNIRILVTYDSKRQNNYFYFVPHRYPSSEDYMCGVKLGLLSAERKRPQAKQIQKKLRNRANQLILEEGFHEVLLVNHHDQITEGSRSNVFFLKGQTFITPPAEQVLKGITRQKVIECIHIMNFDLVEEYIEVSKVKQFDAVFLTGTSPKVLPVSQINNIQFKSDNQLVLQLKLKLDEMINTEIKNNQPFFHS